MDLKVGDKVYCHTTGRIIDTDGWETDRIFAIAGKYYEVTQVYSDDKICLEDEDGDRHHSWTINQDFFDHFSFEPPTPWSGNILKFHFI